MAKGSAKKFDASKIARYVAISINVTFCIAAIIIIIIAGSVVVIPPDSLAGSLFEELSVTSQKDILIVSGFGTIVAACLGVLGAAKRWRPCLVLYVVSLVIIISIQISLGTFLKNTSNDSNMDTLRAKYNEDTTQGQAMRQSIMQMFVCCGFDDYYDKGLRPYCDEVISYDFITPSLKKCGVNQIKTYLEKTYIPVGAAAIGLGVVEILALLATMGIIFAAKEVREQFSVDY